jgi:hypothetical protein
LKGDAEIREQEMKLREERDQGRMRKLQYESGVNALEEARARRARLSQADAQVKGAHELVKGIVSSNLDPMTKAQKLAEAELENAPIAATNPDVSQVFDLARNAIPQAPEPAITNAQRWSAALKGIPQEVIDEAVRTGDRDIIANAMAEIEAQKEIDVEAKRLKLARTSEAEKMKQDLAESPLKFQKGEFEGEESDWLEPESTQKATLIVKALGTPEEQRRFDELKSAGSDRFRADLIEKIQLRERLKMLGGPKRMSASSVTGLP